MSGDGSHKTAVVWIGFNLMLCVIGWLVRGCL